MSNPRFYKIFERYLKISFENQYHDEPENLPLKDRVWNFFACETDKNLYKS